MILSLNISVVKNNIIEWIWNFVQFYSKYYAYTLLYCIHLKENQCNSLFGFTTLLLTLVICKPYCSGDIISCSCAATNNFSYFLYFSLQCTKVQIKHAEATK